MAILKKFFPLFILFAIAVLFFHKYFLFGLVPFPGDLLLAEYQPFRSYSYEGYVPGSVPNKAQYFDSIREFYPWRTFTTNELKAGRLPLWNPHNFSGSPHLANFQTAVFYPLNSIYLAIDQIDAWSLMVFLQPLLSSFFAYLYCRRIGINTYGAVLASIAFSYSTYMNVWLEFQVVGHTILWLPFIFYSIELLVEKYSFKNFLLVTCSLLFSLFAGHPLDFGSTFLFSGCYLVFRQWKGGWKKYALYCLPYVAVLILGSPQLVPTIKLLQNSTRAPFSYEFLVNNILVQPPQFVMLLVPDFFGNPATRNYWATTSYVGNTLSVGVVALVFVLFTILWRKKYLKNTLVTFFMMGAAFTFILATKNPISLIVYKIQFPILSTIQPTKLLSLFGFSLAVLAGFGTNAYMAYKDRLLRQHFRYLSMIFITLALVLLQAFFVPPEHRIVALKWTILAICMSIFAVGGIVASLQLNKYKKLLLVVLTILLVGEHYISFQKFNPFVPRAFVFPKASVLEFLQKNAGINRVWGYGTAQIDSNIATQYRLYSTDGFDALNLKWYNQLVRTSKDGRTTNNFTHETRSVAEIEPGYGEIDLPNNKFRLRVLDTLGVKYVLDRVENPKNNDTFPSSRFKLVWEDEAGWKVYKNLLSAPRYFLTNNIDTYINADEFEIKFFSDSFNPNTMALVEDKYPETQLCTDEGIKNSTVTLDKYEPTTIIFKTKAECPTFLFLSDTFDPNWQATIDDNFTTIYKTDYALRGLLIPAGTHTILFKYSLF